MHDNLLWRLYSSRRLLSVTDIRLVIFRAVSDISGSRVPDNRLGYPNPNFGTGTRNVALWEESKDDLIHGNGILKAFVNVSVIQSV